MTRAVDLSASCKAIFGLPPEEQASAERLFSLIHADDREAVVTRLKKPSRRGPPTRSSIG